VGCRPSAAAANIIRTVASPVALPSSPPIVVANASVVHSSLQRHNAKPEAIREARAQRLSSRGYQAIRPLQSLRGRSAIAIAFGYALDGGIAFAREQERERVRAVPFTRRGRSWHRRGYKVMMEPLRARAGLGGARYGALLPPHTRVCREAPRAMVQAAWVAARCVRAQSS
jgi:hypothetical protein